MAGGRVRKADAEADGFSAVLVGNGPTGMIVVALISYEVSMIVLTVVFIISIGRVTSLTRKVALMIRLWSRNLI